MVLSKMAKAIKSREFKGTKYKKGVGNKERGTGRGGGVPRGWRWGIYWGIFLRHRLRLSLRLWRWRWRGERARARVWQMHSSFHPRPDSAQMCESDTGDGCCWTALTVGGPQRWSEGPSAKNLGIDMYTRMYEVGEGRLSAAWGGAHALSMGSGHDLGNGRPRAFGQKRNGWRCRLQKLEDIQSPGTTEVERVYTEKK